MAKKDNTRKPTLFEERVKPNWETLRLGAQAGATNAELAASISISRNTFQKYVKDFPELDAMLREARLSAVPLVKQALFMRAIGHEHVETTTTIKPDQDGVPREYVTTVKKWYPPDTSALAMWLRNYSDGWRDKDAFYEECKKMELEMQKERLERDNF